MKNFSSRTKKSSLPISKDRKILFRAVVYIVVALFAVVFLKSVVGTLTSDAMLAFMRVREYFAQSSAALPSYVRSRDELQVEISRLNEELASRSGDSATIGRLAAENEELRALLSDTNDDRILAGVIARPPLTPYDVLVLDRGSAGGVTEGAIVYHAHNHAIGMVGKTFENLSLVTLFSSPDVETTVYLYGPDIFAYAYGEGGGVIRVSIPQGITVKEGDPVVLPSLHMGDVGLVERVVSVPTQPEQNAYVTFPTPLQSLRTVTISKDAALLPTSATVHANIERMREVLFFVPPETTEQGNGTSTATTSSEGTAVIQ